MEELQLLPAQDLQPLFGLRTLHNWPYSNSPRKHLRLTVHTAVAEWSRAITLELRFKPTIQRFATQCFNYCTKGKLRNIIGTRIKTPMKAKSFESSCLLSIECQPFRSILWSTAYHSNFIYLYNISSKPLMNLADIQCYYMIRLEIISFYQPNQYSWFYWQ